MADRFKRIYSQGMINSCQIFVDTLTGVNYLFTTNGEAGGLTVLLDSSGRPVISAEYRSYDPLNGFEQK